MNTHGHTVEEWRAIRRDNERKHFERHPEKVRAKWRRAGQKNKEKKKISSAQWRAANRDKVLADKKKWQQDNWEYRQKYMLEYVAKNADKLKAQGKLRYEQKKVEMGAQAKAYMENLPPEEKERRRLHANKRSGIYRRNHRAKYAAHAQHRRALKLSLSVDPKKVHEWFVAMKSRKTVRCYYCSKLLAGSDCHIDHIKPISKGGLHAVENLCVSCPACNLSKNDTLIGEWNPKGQFVFPI